MSTNPSSSQKFSRNKQAGGGAYIPATLRIVGPSIHAKLVLERIRKRPFVSAKTKKRCQLKCCNFNLSIKVVYKRTYCLYFVYFYMAATQKLSCRHLVGPSLPRPTLFCFGLVWSNHIARKMYPEMDIRRTEY